MKRTHKTHVFASCFYCSQEVNLKYSAMHGIPLQRTEKGGQFSWLSYGFDLLIICVVLRKHRFKFLDQLKKKKCVSATLQVPLWWIYSISQSNVLFLFHSWSSFNIPQLYFAQISNCILQYITLLAADKEDRLMDRRVTDVSLPPGGHF